jgi:hypothetical protein
LDGIIPPIKSFLKRKMQTKDIEEVIDEPIPCNLCGKEHPIRKKEYYVNLKFMQNDSFEKGDCSIKPIFLKVFDSKEKNDENIYLVTSSQDEHKKMKWVTLRSLKTFGEIYDIMNYEGDYQYHLAYNMFDQLQDNIRNSKKEWIGLCYNRFIEGNSRGEVQEKLKKEEDVLPASYFVFQRDGKPFIPQTRKRIRTKCDFGQQGVQYSPTRGKSISAPDLVDYTLSSPSNTHQINLNNIMLDTGCDLTEGSRNTIQNVLQLNPNDAVEDRVKGVRDSDTMTAMLQLGIQQYKLT